MTLAPTAHDNLVRYIEHERPEWTRQQVEQYIAEQERLLAREAARPR